MVHTTPASVAFALALILLTNPSPAFAQAAAPADVRDANLDAYITLLRSDIRAQKAAVIAEVMQFTEAEDAKFWPAYREYEAELAAINDERIALIADYAVSYETLTNESADRLAAAALALEGRRHALKSKYYDRIKQLLEPKTAARVLQVENQILLLLDLQIAAALPIASR
jgi:hypothetical protein